MQEEETINYILIEDRKNVWEDFQYILENQFENLLIPHPRNRYLESFIDMENNLYQAMMDGDLDLIISDISLGFNVEDENTWVTKLLRNIVERRLTLAQRNAIFQNKGMGLILVTQFPKANLPTIIGNDLAFLHRFFPNWSFLDNNKFENKIADKIDIFRKNFTFQRTGWYHNNNLENYLTAPYNRRFKFYLRDVPPITLLGNNIIAATTTQLYYLEENDEVVVMEHDSNEGINDFIVEANINLLQNGRDGEKLDPNTLVPFLHIRSRPTEIINSSLPWRFRKLNRGRELILDSNRDIRFGPSFPLLNRYIDTNYRLLNE